MDVLEALAASCTQLAAAWTPRAAFNLACDVAVASLLLVLHGATLMSQVGGGSEVPAGTGKALCRRVGQGERPWVPAHLLGLPFLSCAGRAPPVPLRVPLWAASNARSATVCHKLAAAPALPSRQAMVFGVAMNSRKNTLVALLIAANFTEIKGKHFPPLTLFF